MKKIIHGCLEIGNVISLVEIYMSLVCYAHLCDIKLNTQREIPYLLVPMYYFLYICVSGE